MNRRVSALGPVICWSPIPTRILRNKLGREANLLDMRRYPIPSWQRALETGEGFAGHDRVFPGGGQVPSGRPPGLRLLSGARGNRRRWAAAARFADRKLTVGVLHRVDQLADRPGAGGRFPAPSKA